MENAEHTAIVLRWANQARVHLMGTQPRPVHLLNMKTFVELQTVSLSDVGGIKIVHEHVVDVPRTRLAARSANNSIQR